jgi:hypothetical protein
MKGAADAFAAAGGRKYTIRGGKYKFETGTKVDGLSFSEWTRSTKAGHGRSVLGAAAKKKGIEQERYVSWGAGGKSGQGHRAAMLVPKEGLLGRSSPIQTRKDIGRKGQADDIHISFPLSSLEQPIVEEGQETAFIKHIRTQTKEYALKIGKSLGAAAGKPVGMGNITSELSNVKGFEGAVNAAAGAAFEVAARAGFGFTKDKKVRNKADFDVTHAAQVGRLESYFDSLPKGTTLADLKITASKDNVKSMKEKILKLEYGVTSKAALEKYFGTRIQRFSISTRCRQKKTKEFCRCCK